MAISCMLFRQEYEQLKHGMSQRHLSAYWTDKLLAHLCMTDANA
jgi:hypothetical protein